MSDLDQQLKNLDKNLFPKLSQRYAESPEVLKENLRAMQAQEPNIPMGTLMANLESDLQSLSNPWYQNGVE